jgi:hypothetical protein
MTESEIVSDVASGYLTKAGTAAGYLVKSGTAAAIEISGGIYKEGSKKPHKQGHYSPMELLAMGGPREKSLFLEFYQAFRNRKQLTFGRKILAAYRDMFGTVPGEDFEIVRRENTQQPDEDVIISLKPRQLYALRHAGKAVRVLELVELGRLSDAQDLIDLVWDNFCENAYLRAVANLSGRCWPQREFFGLG